MTSHVPILESAISDVGYWRWWIADLPERFQLEFGGARLWSPPWFDAMQRDELEPFGIQYDRFVARRRRGLGV